VGKSSIINCIQDFNLHSRQQHQGQEGADGDEDHEEVETDIFSQFDAMLQDKHQRKIKGLTNHRKVEVSAMPGKTKVVQTIFIPD